MFHPNIFISGAQLEELVTAAGIEAYVEAYHKNVKKGKSTSNLSELVTSEHFEKILALRQSRLREARGENDEE